MKFSELRDNELRNKVRTIKDLVNYVGRTSPTHSNYNIFLGAGASVSSGISSGGALVEQWRKEIYEEHKGNYYKELDLTAPDLEEKARTRAIEYLIRDHGVWYNPQNEYSSLFERKFDLPSQRRRFVENIVDEKLPSIGYLYLITLINSGYFNTIFTTNFDDLINEAFYQFSNIRPIVCAHDSAVNSISIVGKRPKIIKLHGDYLFDDIKNTIKETESLELNTKDKFIEFSKDNGLIIVGYSGQDRSILEVLNYLLQQEDYLKNGIYWCFRPDDEINHEVRKILWKDKVYCVQIDSFDELFTNFCNYIPLKPNLIDTSKDSKREKCIQKFIEDYQAKPIQNPTIKEFIEEISNVRNNQNISDLIRQLNESKNGNLSPEKLKGLLEVENLINKKQFDEALSLINKKLDSSLDEDLEAHYISSKIKIYKLKNEREKAIELIDTLISNDKYNAKYYQWKFSFLKSINEKIDFLKGVTNILPYNFPFKNSLIKLLINRQKNFEPISNFSFDYCDKLINESINLDASLDNEIYALKFEYLLFRKTKEVNKKTGEPLKKDFCCDTELSKLISDVTKINKHHSESINLRRAYCIEKKDIELINSFIQDLDDIKTTSSKNKINKIDYIVGNIYNELTTSDLSNFKNKEKFSINTIDKFFNEYSHDDYKNKNLKFHIEKANYLISKQKNLKLVYESLLNIIKLPDSYELIKSIFNLFCTVRDVEINNELFEFLLSNKVNIERSDYLYCMYTLEASRENYIDSLNHLEKYYNIENMEEDDYITYIYHLLLAKKYTDINNFIKANNAEISLLSKKSQSVILINQLTAKKLDGNTLTSNEIDNLRNLISNNKDNKSILICANSLIDKQNPEAFFHIKEQINLDYRFYYLVTQWPAINDQLKKDTNEHFANIGKPISIVA